jgi:hypothetical protein
VRPQLYICHALDLAPAMPLETAADAVIETLPDADAADLERGPDLALVANIALHETLLHEPNLCKASVTLRIKLYRTDDELRNFSKLTISQEDRVLYLINTGPRRWMHTTRHLQHSHRTASQISQHLLQFYLREQKHQPMDHRRLLHIQLQLQAQLSPTRRPAQPPQNSRSFPPSSTQSSRRKQ